MFFLGHTPFFRVSISFWHLSLWNGLHFWHGCLLHFSAAPSRPRSRAASCKEPCPVFPVCPERLLLRILAAGYFICTCKLHHPSSICFLSASSVPCPHTYPFYPLSQPTYLWLFSISHFSLQPRNVHKSHPSLNVLLKLHASSYIFCVLPFKLKALGESKQRALFSHSTFLLLSSLLPYLCPYCFADTAPGKGIDALLSKCSPYRILIYWLSLCTEVMISCLGKLTLSFPKVCSRGPEF